MKVEFLDQTLRDGQQSLWGMRMQARHALPACDTLDNTGFRVIDLTGSHHFEVLVRHCREDPWAMMDALVSALPRTVLRSGMRANAAISFRTTPDVLMDLWMRQLNRHGARSFWIYDVLFDIERTRRLARVAKEFGSEIAGAIMFTLSPVHTDDYYAEKARALAAIPEVDTLLLYDTGGVLEKERLSTLLPAIVTESHGKPIEFHANNLMGQSAKAYCDALELGVSILHTASRPMANGPSVPSTECIAANLAHLGYSHDLDLACLPPVAAHFEAVGKACGFLVNQHAEYDLFTVTHQIPGGMVGTLKAQLKQHGMEDRLEEVLTEIASVRRELGWPGMATPFSQLVGIQAVLNIVSGERWSIIPEEVITYAAGHYGQPVAPIEPDVLDRIMADSKAKQVLANPPEQPSLEDLYHRHGTRDDDELFLRALIPQSDIDRMRAAGPLVTDLPLASSAEADQVIRLMNTLSSRQFRLASETLSVELSR
ncbi:pyruvate carboxylase [Erythrobacter sp.]|uniref:pyruvate carboxylase n=1 Tax=Erythrobacter sp. TaxID=1042 RepID=UPI001B02E6B6|nr:pyruvate carboxylase [Erythrobacter sp.]MBO6525428.1 pyruvate carboxylase [Erythrobacter sp.]MBO6529899.1 pyruvate carboxylase [Erythrobacter sp.]